MRCFLQKRFGIAQGLLALFLISTLLPLAHGRIEKGSTFPATSLPVLNSSKQMTLGQAQTTPTRTEAMKVILVNFWASWCEPCKEELPALARLNEKHRAKGFQVVAVNLDENQDDATQFLKRYPVSFPTLRDEKQALAQKLELDRLPTSFLLDSAGRVAFRHVGFRKGDIEKIEGEILKLLSLKQN